MSNLIENIDKITNIHYSFLVSGQRSMDSLCQMEQKVTYWITIETNYLILHKIDK